MAWQIDSWVVRRSFTIGTTATQILLKNALRAGYRVISAIVNTGIIYHGYTSIVSASSPDYILPGGRLRDEGEWQSVHHGEVWLVSNLASQTVHVEEILTLKKPRDYEKLPWWQRY